MTRAPVAPHGQETFAAALRRALAVLALLVAAGLGGSPAHARDALGADRCALLAGGVPNGQIAAAKWSEATKDRQANCAVQLQLASEPGSHIKVLVLLPADWNGRLLGIGDHGFGGYLPEQDMQGPLGRGFAVFGNDMGHTGGMVDARWMVAGGPALKDFGWRAAHLSVVAAKTVVAQAYGAPAHFAYYQGCSTGGRVGMREAQQFPDDYDGVIAGSGPLDWNGILTQQLWAALQVQRNGKQTPGYIAPERYPMITAAALAQCDMLDGLKDGLATDPRRCPTTLRQLQCRGGDTANCLSAPQVEAIERTYAPLVDPATGAFVFDGLEPTGEVGWISPLGPDGGPGAHVLGYFSAIFGQPNWDWRSFDFHTDLARARSLDKAGAQIDSLSTNLAPFRKHGGKIIQYHGWLDQAMTPSFYPRFYDAVAASTSAGDTRALASFYRLFMAPGMEHCFGGPGPNSFGGLGQPQPPVQDSAHDVLSALVAWVEQGRAPDQIIATQYKGDKPEQGVVRQMPLCAYPKVATWRGRGDPNDPASFACAAGKAGAVSRP
jgi:feruloyl esterase